MSDLLASVDALLARPTDHLPPPAVRKALREADGLTQGQVAEVMQVSRISFLAWERGQSRPRGERLKAYAHLLRGLAAKYPDVAALPETDAK